MTTVSSTHGAITLSRIHFCGYVGHVTRLYSVVCLLLHAHVCLAVGLELVSGWLVDMHAYLYYFLLSLSHTLVCKFFI